MAGFGGEYTKIPAIDRFWMRVSPEPNSGCWLWEGHLCRGSSKKEIGYGRIGVNGKMMQAHRFSYETFVGPIPVGLELDHLCRMPCCVNPDHLEPVTHRENVIRGDGPKSWPSQLKAKTHCPKGHPYSGDNLYISKDGKRTCKRCRANASLAWFHKKKLENG